MFLTIFRLQGGSFRARCHYLTGMTALQVDALHCETFATCMWQSQRSKESKKMMMCSRCMVFKREIESIYSFLVGQRGHRCAKA